jgi:hypothetical protein
MLSTLASNTWGTLLLDSGCFLFWHSLCLQTREATSNGSQWLSYSKESLLSSVSDGKNSITDITLEH